MNKIYYAFFFSLFSYLSLAMDTNKTTATAMSVQTSTATPLSTEPFQENNGFLLLAYEKLKAGDIYIIKVEDGKMARSPYATEKDAKRASKMITEAMKIIIQLTPSADKVHSIIDPYFNHIEALQGIKHKMVWKNEISKLLQEKNQ